MQMAQIPERRSIFFAHSAREIRIIQPLIPRRFRHVLQNTQPLLNRLPALRRHLLPFRQHFIADVVALIGRHLFPYLRPLSVLLLLLWRKLPESSFILLESPPLLRRVITRTPRRIRGPVIIEIRSLNGVSARIWRAIPSVARVPHSPLRIHGARITRRIEVASWRFSITARRFGNPPLRLHPARFLLWLPALLPLLWSSLLILLLPMFLRRLVFLAALRPIRARILRRTLQRHPRADRQRQQPTSGLEPQFHRALHILTLLLRIVSRRRLRQLRQRLEARDHIVVFQHGNIGRINRRVDDGPGKSSNPQRPQ